MSRGLVTRACGTLATLLAAALASMPAAAATDPYAPKGIPDGYTVIEEDILVRTADLKGGRMAPLTSFLDNALWPGGVVYYEFDANVTMQVQIDAALAAMDTIRTRTGNNIAFVVRTNQSDYVHIQNSTGNNSLVGRQGGQQVVNILNWSVTVIAHELGHALGLWHEQSRADRDQYVTINWSNISQNGCGGNSCNDQFAIRSAGQDYADYDFDSMMHYSQCAFSIAGNCPTTGRTIDVKPPYDVQWQGAIGQRTHMSYRDALTLKFLYAPSSWRFVDPVRAGEVGTGSFIRPWGDLDRGLSQTPASGTLLVEPGAYAVLPGAYGTAMTLRSPRGGVRIVGSAVTASVRGGVAR